MGGVPALLVAPAAGLAANVLIHAFLARAATAIGPIRVQFIAFGGGALVMLAILTTLLLRSSFSAADSVGYFISHALIYACFGFCLFNVISANVSSLRVRILKEMLAQDPVPMTDATLSARYSAREMVLARLARLEAGGQIELHGGRYRLRRSGLTLLGRVFAALRRFLLRA